MSGRVNQPDMSAEEGGRSGRAGAFQGASADKVHKADSRPLTDQSTDHSRPERGAASLAAAPVIIKKYANRRLYDTSTSSYVTLDHLASLVQAGTDFSVIDARSHEDLTRAVLTQIVVEQESRGGHLLPVGFLRQIIGCYGQSVEELVPGYLELCMNRLNQEQERLSRQLAHIGQAGHAACDKVAEQAQRNFNLFERSFKTWFTAFVERIVGSAVQGDGDQAIAGAVIDPAQGALVTDAAACVQQEASSGQLPAGRYAGPAECQSLPELPAIGGDAPSDVSEQKAPLDLSELQAQLNSLQEQINRLAQSKKPA